MSTRFDTDSSDCLFGSTNLLNPVVMSICLWVKFVTAGAGAIRSVWTLTNSGNSVNNGILWNPSNLAQMNSGANATAYPVNPTIGNWNFMAFTATTAGVNSANSYYRDNASTVLSTVASATGVSFTSAQVIVGQVAANIAAAAELAYYMEFDSVLTPTQLLAQSNTPTPITAGGLVLRRNLQMTTAATAGNDTSGNGFNLTVSGTLTDGSSNPTFPSAGGTIAAAEYYYGMLQ